MNASGSSALAAVVLAVLAACGTGTGGGAPASYAVSEDGLGIQRFAVSLQGEDVGYMELRVEENGPDSLRVSQRIDWNMILMGTRRDIVMTLDATTDRSMNLGGLVMSFSDGMSEIEIRAVRRGSVLTTSIGTAGRTIESEAVLTEDFLPVLADLACASMDWTPGQTRTFQTFDPASGTVLSATAACSTFQDVCLLGDTVSAALLRLTQMGTSNLVWVHDGQIVRETETGLDMDMTRVPPDQTGRIVATRDLYDVFAVSTDPISSPRSSGTRRYVLLGDIDWSLYDLQLPPVQTAAGCTVTVSTTVPSVAAPFPPEVPGDLQAFLLPEPMVQCADTAVVAVAESLTAGAVDSWEAARRICSWVDLSVQNSPTVSLPSAVDVLEYLRGDCNEHTILAVALARAAGLPARVCAGIVYIDGTFGYHAWPVVWVGEWVEMDPTFGQYVADATHIILATGSLEAQYVINSAIGRLSVRELGTP